MYVKKEKCELCVQEIHFMGHIIGGGHVRMDVEKVQAIRKWPTLVKVVELPRTCKLLPQVREELL